MYKMWHAATDGVAWLSACLSRSWALQQRMNRSRCCLVGWFMWTQGTSIRWGQDLRKGRDNFGGCPAHCKNIVKHRILQV